MTKQLAILDCNNFWSPSGGGVRRYHLQKLQYFQSRPDIRYVFLMNDASRRTERIGENAFIEHVPAPKFPYIGEYRFLLKPGLIREAVLRYGIDVIEIGSPYIMPWMVRRALSGIQNRPKMVGFWHADFPVTYANRFFSRFGASFGKAAESLAWWHARQQFHPMDAIFVPSPIIMERMRNRGMRNLRFQPLGVDAEAFHPEKRDLERVSSLKAGLPERLTIFFGHRFMEEKGLRTFLAAYPLICHRLGHEPAVVFAGTGPDTDLVEAAVNRNPHMRYIGFVKDPSEMAIWYASCEMGFALSGWETFGLSIVEAMACGQLLVGANEGAAREHIEQSGAGLTIPVAHPIALAEAVARLHSGFSQDEKVSMRHKARTYAGSLDWKNCFRREVAVYRELCGMGDDGFAGPDGSVNALNSDTDNVPESRPIV